MSTNRSSTKVKDIIVLQSSCFTLNNFCGISTETFPFFDTQFPSPTVLHDTDCAQPNITGTTFSPSSQSYLAQPQSGGQEVTITCKQGFSESSGVTVNKYTCRNGSFEPQIPVKFCNRGLRIRICTKLKVCQRAQEK